MIFAPFCKIAFRVASSAQRSVDDSASRAGGQSLQNLFQHDGLMIGLHAPGAGGSECRSGSFASMPRYIEDQTRSRPSRPATWRAGERE